MAPAVTGSQGSVRGIAIHVGDKEERAKSGNGAQVANLGENAPEDIRKAYWNYFRVIFLLSLPLGVTVATIAPIHRYKP